MTSSVTNTILAKIGALVLGTQRKQFHSQQSGPMAFQEVAPLAIGSRLAALADEHNDLDIAISVLLEAGNRDDLLISRLKKRKLQIKDEIASITPRPNDDGRAVMIPEMASCVA